VSGIEFHDRLAARAPEVLDRLVLMSGDTSSAEATELLPRLKQPLVQKPFDMRALADLLDRIAPPAPATAPALPPGAATAPTVPAAPIAPSA
jgi:hypothetical protein